VGMLGKPRFSSQIPPLPTNRTVTLN